MSTLIIATIEIGLHFGVSCGILHVGLLIHAGQIYEALVHTVSICLCLLLFAASLYASLEILKSNSRKSE